MANVRTFSRSFAGGEVTPEFFGRIDDAKYQTGAAKCLNFIPLPHGPVANRPGFAFVKEAKYSGTKKVRLIPFSFSTTQTMVLEFGDQYIRFHTQGGTLRTDGTVESFGSAKAVYEVATPYLVADLFDIHYVQSADVLTLVHPNYAPRELRRYGAVNWALSAINFLSSLSAPVGVTVTATQAASPANLVDYFYEVTAVAGDGLDESLPSVSVQTNVQNNLFQTGAYNTITWAAASGAKRYKVYKQSNGLYGYIGETDGLTFKDDNITADLSITPPQMNAPFTNNIIQSIPVVNGGSGYVSVSGTWFFPFVNLTISDATGTGATAIGLLNSGSISGVWVTNGGSNYTNPTFSVSVGGGGSGAVFGAAVLSGTGNYPGAVSYHQQRRIFAGTTNKPQNMWMTRTGTESNLNYSLPSRDDDAISVRVAAREANTIRHIVPLQDIVLLTSSAEWRAMAANSDVITPTTIAVKPQSYIGANNVQPVTVNNNLIYAAARGGHVREMAYNWQAGGFVTGDLSLRAPHLFDGNTLVDMAYAKSPQPICWFVSSTGKLLGLTYVPEQQVGAWHQHDTDGVFESIAVVAEGDEDVLYAVVKRTFNGTDVRYVERMRSRLFADASDAFFVDSGATYYKLGTFTRSGTTMTCSYVGHGITNGATGYFSFSDTSFGAYRDYRAYVVTVVDANTFTIQVANAGATSGSWAQAAITISGLAHLNGKTVNILADGAVHPQRVVSGGSITLDQYAAKVQVGLPITADLQTLPLAMQIDGGFGQGRYKNVNRTWLRVYRSSGIFVGPNAGELVEAKQRTTEVYGSPPVLKSEEIQVVLTPTWADSGQVYVRQSDPLPLTIVSMTLEVAVGG